MIYLINKDSKGKFRIAHLSYEWTEDHFVIHRETYQLGGKHTQQPDKTVYRGKASRTIKEQVTLEFNHLIKEFCDKGYKKLDKVPEEYSNSELEEIVGAYTTGADGVIKPMLAKQESKVTNRNIFEKEWYASRKIDGLRVLIYLGNDGKLHTASRGAMNYDAAMSDILEHPTLIKLLKKNPWLILDGECYKHGMTLQQINSVARTQVTAVDYEILQFYWYDIALLNKSFEERLKIMNNIKSALKLTFEPEREFKDNELRIQFVPQEPISGWLNIEKLHNQYVSEGWEGLVLRDPTKNYKPSGRSNDMIKVKKYLDEEFLITGYELGLRGSEDMCFICETHEGKQFKAKPHGDRKQKEWYVNNFNTECLNHYATVKYFYMSEDNIPLQPSVSSIRIFEDM